MRIAFRVFLCLLILTGIFCYAVPVQATEYLYEHVDIGLDSTGSDVYTQHTKAQEFTATSNHRITHFKLRIGHVGSPTGTVTAYLEGDSGSVPDKNHLATSNGVSVTSWSGSAWVTFTLQTPYTVTSGTQYWIVLIFPGGNSSNRLFWSANIQTSYADGGCAAGTTDDESGAWSPGATSTDHGFQVYDDNTVGAASVTTNAASSVYALGMRINGTINSIGTDSVVQGYFEWGTTTAYGNQTPVNSYSGTGAFHYDLEDVLEPEITYHYRAVIVGANSGMILGGDIQQATTANDTPVIRTDPATDIKNNSATIHAKILSIGEAEGFKYWYEWGEDTDYGNVLEGDITNDTLFTGAIEESDALEGLETNTTYHYRVVGVAGEWVPPYDFLWIHEPGYWDWGGMVDFIYGEDVSFTTANRQVQITTGEFTGQYESWQDVTIDTAHMWGTVDENPNNEPLVVYFQYKACADPPETYDHTTQSQLMSGTGRFQIDAINLTASTTYHYRAVAQRLNAPVPENPYVYGADHAFITHALNSTPTPIPTTTFDVVKVKTYGYQWIQDLEGYDGGAIILQGQLLTTGKTLPVAVGFEYGISTSYGTRIITENRNQTGIYSATIQGIYPGQAYHFRAIAIGSNVSLGDDKSFTMSNTVPTPTRPVSTGVPVAPSVTTMIATELTSHTAVLHGTVTHMGNASVIAVGFEIGPDTNYGMTMIYGNAYGPSDFSVTVTNLVSNGTYHYRAIGMGGYTGYGIDMTFTTKSGTGGGGGTGDDSGNPVSKVNSWLNGFGWDNQAGHWIVLLLVMFATILFCVVLIPGDYKALKAIITCGLPILEFFLALVTSFIWAWVGILAVLCVAVAFGSFVVKRFRGGSGT